MKLLIIDDEAHVRKALHLIIEKADLGITQLYEAADAGRALELIEREDPQIIISDVVMPEMTGIQLIEQLKTSHPYTKTIIVSGHNDFHYVRSALRAGSIDYLLKPLGREQIAAAVTKAVRTWNEEAKMREQVIANTREVDQLSAVYQRVLLSRMLYGSVKQEEQEKLMRGAGMVSFKNGCQLLLLSFTHLQHQTGQIPLLTQISVEEVIRELLKSQDVQGITYANQKAFTECVILLPSHFNAAHLCESIREQLIQEIGCCLPFAISPCLDFPTGLPSAYEQAVQFLYMTPLTALTEGIAFKAGQARWTKSTKRAELKIPASFRQEMFSAILSGSTHMIQEHACKWTALLSEEACVLSDITLLLRRYEAIKLSVLNDIRSDFSRNLQNHWKSTDKIALPFNSCGWFKPELLSQLLEDDLTDLANQFQLNQRKEASVIQEIILYIREHYKEEINQSLLADRFFISKDYLSHKFKEETGMGMVHYLNLLRIEKSKQLLMLPNAKINEVAAAIGYNDEKYFCKVFKKYELISPSQYRENLRSH